MRWIKKTKVYPREYDRRTKSGFIFFPRNLKNDVRWLEYATWEEMYTWSNGWFPVRWEDDK